MRGPPRPSRRRVCSAPLRLRCDADGGAGLFTDCRICPLVLAPSSPPFRPPHLFPSTRHIIVILTHPHIHMRMPTLATQGTGGALGAAVDR